MNADHEAGRRTSPRSRPFALTLLYGAAALTITLAGMRSVADIITPVFLALVITVTVHPVRRALERTRLPAWLVSVVMLVCAYLLILVLTLALTLSVAQLATLIPQYTSELTQRVTDLGGALQTLGVDQEQIDRMVNAIDPGQLVSLVGSLLSGTLGVLSDLLFLFTVLLFMAFDTNGLRRGLAVLADRFPDPVTALAHFTQGTRSYMGVSAVFGLIVAVIDGVVLYLLDVPGAFAWAVLAFVTNFIPNIGFVIGLIPPALIALLEDGPGLMLTVIALYSVINFVIQSIIQPRVVGDTVGLSPTLTFLSLVFWTWVLGPLAALLAVPLSLLMRALLVEADPGASWALPLISGKPAPAGEPMRPEPAPPD
ncbi:AI-2E family transporter [Nocardioides sp.]|uniref:AI-2E family transporter n=1 Tax=Nocardioides sp. TaxID=35761 RepID=UPI002ED04E80